MLAVLLRCLFIYRAGLYVSSYWHGGAVFTPMRALFMRVALLLSALGRFALPLRKAAAPKRRGPFAINKSLDHLFNTISNMFKCSDNCFIKSESVLSLFCFQCLVLINLALEHNVNLN